jgi:hypothetical protein
MIIANFLAPILMIVILVDPLFKNLLVPKYLNSEFMLAFQIMSVLICCGFRALTFREELQFQFNESYFLIHRLMLDKNAQVFRYVKLRIT